MYKKRLIFASFVSMLISYSIAQSLRIEGAYCNDYGKIIITSDTFYYLDRSYSHSNEIKYNDTLAICTWKEVDNKILFVKSKDPYDDIKVSVRDCDKINPDNDSVRISFNMSNIQKDIKIWINYDTTSKLMMDLTNGTNYVVPRTTRCFSFIIEPNSGVKEHTALGEFYGLLYFRSPEIEINSEKDIEISIPNFSMNFFSKYYIRGDYIYIDGNNIFWRGEKYMKIKD